MTGQSKVSRRQKSRVARQGVAKDEAAKPKRGRGRPQKVFSENDEVNEACKRAHNSWDFTDFEGPEDPERVLDLWTHFKLNTLIICEEVCPKTSTLHWQGRIVLPRKIRFEAFKKLLHPRVHIEPSVCQHDDNYCRKMTSKRVCDIDRRHKGKRLVFAEQLDAIENSGASLRDCQRLEGANWQSQRSAEMCMKYNEPPREVAPRQVHLINSKADKRKMFSAVESLSEMYVLSNKVFWDGYDAHKHIYVDQKKLKFSIEELEDLIDEFPFRVGRYGRQARHDHVYISGLSSDECRILNLVPSGLLRGMSGLELMGSLLQSSKDQ